MLLQNILRAKIIEKGSSVSEISKIMGINNATFYRKLKKGDEGFSIKDVKIVVNHLELTREETDSIFFA